MLVKVLLLRRSGQRLSAREVRAQLLMDLSATLRAIVSQRLVRREDGQGRAAALEILLNTPTIAEKIFTGHFNEIKDIMEIGRAHV